MITNDRWIEAMSSRKEDDLENVVSKWKMGIHPDPKSVEAINYANTREKQMDIAIRSPSTSTGNIKLSTDLLT